MKDIRQQRWDKAFNSLDDDFGSQSIALSRVSSVAEELNLKATIVLEHIIQAADVSHTMQHWSVYNKWNERLFQEMYSAYDQGRAEKDPSEGWYKGTLARRRMELESLFLRFSFVSVVQGSSGSSTTTSYPWPRSLNTAVVLVCQVMSA